MPTLRILPVLMGRSRTLVPVGRRNVDVVMPATSAAAQPGGWGFVALVLGLAYYFLRRAR